MMYDSTANCLRIECLTQSVAWRDVSLAARGGNVGVGMATVAPYGPFTVCSPSNYATAITAKQITIGESSRNSAYYLALGYFNDATLSWCGSIQAITGNAGAPLLLNPNGGAVGIGIPSTTVRSALSIMAGTPQSAAAATQITICEGSNNPNYGLAIGYGQDPGPGWCGALQVTAGGAFYPLVLQPRGGYVGIAKTAPIYALDVGGDVNITGAFRVNGVALSSGGVTTQTKPARAIGSIYQNTTGKAMFVVATFSVSGQMLLLAYSDASTSPTTQLAYAGNGASTQPTLQMTLSFWVLPGNYYWVNWQVGPSGSGALGTWTEWY